MITVVLEKPLATPMSLPIICKVLFGWFRICLRGLDELHCLHWTAVASYIPIFTVLWSAVNSVCGLQWVGALVHSGPTPQLSYGGRKFWVLYDAAIPGENMFSLDFFLFVLDLPPPPPFLNLILYKQNSSKCLEFSHPPKFYLKNVQAKEKNVLPHLWNQPLLS